MKDLICVNVGKDHIYQCTTRVIGRAGEGGITQLEITIPDELSDYWAYLDFRKPSGETIKTPRLEKVDNVITYVVDRYILSESGDLEVQLVLEKESGESWKSSVKKYENLASINATDDIPEKEDFITNAQAILDKADKLVINVIETVVTVTKTEELIGEDVDGDGKVLAVGNLDEAQNLVSKQNLTIDGKETELYDIEYQGYDDNGDLTPLTTKGIRTKDGSITTTILSGGGAFFLESKDGFARKDNGFELTCTISYDAEETICTIDTPITDVLKAIDEGKDAICKWGNRILRLASYTADTSAEFNAICEFSGSYGFLYRILYDTDGVTAEKKRITLTAVATI